MTKSSFKGKVANNAHKQATSGNSYGYLNIPKGVSVFNPEPGSRIQLDFIPYTVTDEKHPDRDTDAEIAIPGSLWYKRPFKSHRGIGGDNDSVVCLTSVNKKCPICEERARLTREGASKEETDALKPKQRNLYIVVPLDSKNHKQELHIFDVSQYLFQDLLNDELSEDEDRGIFPDLEEGLTLKVRFDEESFNGNKFAKTARIDFFERKEQYDESILDKVPNLDNVLQILSYEDLKAKFFEIDSEDDGGKLNDPDDEETTLPKKKKTFGQSTETPFKDSVNPRVRREPAAVKDDDDDQEKPVVRRTFRK